MTAQEFRIEFDLLYNNITSNMAPGLDDYEVSLFLTQAQEELVQQLYSGAEGFAGFEANERVRRNLANLRHTTQLTVTESNPYQGDFREYPLTVSPVDVGTKKGIVLLTLLQERAEIAPSTCCSSNKKWVNVAPVKYDEINKVLENPFRRPNNNKVLRMDVSTSEVKLISKSVVSKYEYTWLQRPEPIIVADLSEYGVDINGASTAQASMLDESLHRPIVKYAVQLAAASWASNNKN